VILEGDDVEFYVFPMALYGALVDSAL